MQGAQGGCYQSLFGGRRLRWSVNVEVATNRILPDAAEGSQLPAGHRESPVVANGDTHLSSVQHARQLVGYVEDVPWCAVDEQEIDYWRRSSL